MTGTSETKTHNISLYDKLMGEVFVPSAQAHLLVETMSRGCAELDDQGVWALAGMLEASRQKTEENIVEFVNFVSKNHKNIVFRLAENGRPGGEYWVKLTPTEKPKAPERGEDE